MVETLRNIDKITNKEYNIDNVIKSGREIRLYDSTATCDKT